MGSHPIDASPLLAKRRERVKEKRKLERADTKPKGAGAEERMVREMVVSCRLMGLEVKEGEVEEAMKMMLNSHRKKYLPGHAQVWGDACFKKVGEGVIREVVQEDKGDLGKCGGSLTALAKEKQGVVMTLESILSPCQPILD